MAEAADAKSSRPWLGIASTRKVGMAETAAVPAGTPGPQPERIVAQLSGQRMDCRFRVPSVGYGSLATRQELPCWPIA